MNKGEYDAAEFEHDILCDLKFDFTASLQTKSKQAQKWGLLRVKFHRQFESIRNQFTLLAIFLSRIYAKAGWAEPKVAILSPDIFPESSEVMGFAVMEQFKQHGLKEPTLLSRRKDFKKNELSFTSLAPWNDDKLLSQYDLVLVASSNANLSIIQEIVPLQKNLEKTIFFTTCAGIEHARVKNLLKVELLITPFCLFHEYPGDNLDQMVDFKKLQSWERGVCVASLDTTRKILSHQLIKKGLDEETAGSLITQFISATEVEGVEKATEIIKDRLDYSSASQHYYKMENSLTE